MLEAHGYYAGKLAHHVSWEWEGRLRRRSVCHIDYFSMLWSNHVAYPTAELATRRNLLGIEQRDNFVCHFFFFVSVISQIHPLRF